MLNKPHFFHLLKSKVFNMEYFITNHISCNNHNLKLYKYEQFKKKIDN